MSFSRLGDALGRRLSSEVPDEKSRDPSNDQDYVIIDESEHSSNDGDHNKLTQDEVKSSPFENRSPAATSLALRAPSERSLDDEGNLEVPPHTRSLAAFRDQFSEPEDMSQDTARTDYSDFEDHSLPEVLVEKDELEGMDSIRREQYEKALEEANQQHQWAMQAVLRDWEAEKKALLAKLGRVIEARDTLEAELKHSEHSFAGMLEGILDQKLDQMVHVLQEGNMTRSFSGNMPLSPSSASTSTTLNAQQVAADLGVMLDNMRAQQAAVEDRVTSMQSAVLQLVPDQDTADSSEKAVVPKRKVHVRVLSFAKDKFGRPAFGAVRVVQHQAALFCSKVPTVATSAAQRTGGAVRSSFSSFQQMSSHAVEVCKQKAKGIRKEHLQILACLILGGVLGTALASSKIGRPKTQPQKDITEENERELEILGNEPEEDPVLDQSVEIILNRSGVFRRFGKTPEKTLVLAWPRVTVEYN